RTREPLSRRSDVRRRGAAAAADDLRSLLAPAGGELGVLLGPDPLVEAPAPVGEVAEIRIHPERQVGEVAPPREHPVDVVRRKAEARRPVPTVHLAVYAARDRAAAGPGARLPSPPGKPDPQAGDVEPVREADVPRLELRSGQDRPRVRRDHVGARSDVTAVNLE